MSSLRTLTPAQWGELATKYLPTATAFVLVVAIAWFAVNTLWLLLPSETEFDWSPSAATSIEPGPASAGPDLRAVANAHLFGEANAEPVAVKTVDAPDTRLNLKLRGTIAATDESIAHAIISDGSGQARVYFVEDTLSSGAKLHEVYPDRVILERAGTLETLRLPKEVQNAGPSRATPARFSRQPQAPASIQSMLQDNPASFTEIVRPQPYMPNGQLRGYRVYPGRNRRAFAELGFRPGDLVTDINGQPLDNLQNGMQVFSTLGDRSQITVTVERDGNSMTLNIDTTQFNAAGGALQ